MPDDLLAAIYRGAVRQVTATGAVVLGWPAECPFTLEQLLADDWTALGATFASACTA